MENQQDENTIESNLSHMTSKKMIILISVIILTCLSLVYIGSYCHLRSKAKAIAECVNKNPKNPSNLPPGYFIDISFGLVWEAEAHCLPGGPGCMPA